MNEHDKSTSAESEKTHDEIQPVSGNAKIAESAEAMMEKARQATIKLRRRRRKRTVIIK